MRGELEQMIHGGDVSLTLGTLMQLVLVRSPYVLGGELSRADLDCAYRLIPHGRLNKRQFHDQLVKDLATAWRAYDIISPNQDNRPSGRESQVDLFSPEWLADTIAMACQAMPSLTYEQILWEIPLAMTLHLAVSTARRQGTITERPADIGAALEKLKQMKENTHGQGNA